MTERKEYQEFVVCPPDIFIDVKNKEANIGLNYIVDDDLLFQETITISFEENYFQYENSQESLISELTKMLAIAGATSYYKSTCAERLRIDFPITEEVRLWTEALFDHGLREFRFRNNLPLLRDRVSHVDKVEKRPTNKAKVVHMRDPVSQKMLVPIGGGKDSATTLEILQRAGADIIGFSVGSFEPIERCAKVAGIPMIHAIRRIDPSLLEMNASGAPNGHVPVTAINSMIAVIAAVASGQEAVVMSNEASADEPTRVVDSMEINHQWSKSSNAEKLLRDSLSSVSCTVDYFSLLRYLSEFQIFEMFSSFEKYHHAFTSCNRAFRIDETSRATSWCLDCDKCRFVFLGLSAFKGIDYAAKVFGGNMFVDQNQVKGYLDLIGIGDNKPFECVGTVKESRLLARKSLLWDSAATSVVGAALKEVLEGLNQIPEKFPDNTSMSFVPESLSEKIEEIKIELYCSRLSSHIENTTFALVGLGRDTSAIVRFLEKSGLKKNIEVFIPSNPEISKVEFAELLENVGLSNSNFSFETATRSSDLKADVVFVSPGVSRYSEHIVELGERAVGPLAWWLDYQKMYFPEKCFIGVTGTKGKSTTSSLLSHVLPRSIVAGNLGNAVGDIQIEDLLNSDYIVLEISSYQSSYVTTAPDVVAITSLFDCHIDWHVTPENYRRDKLNLALRGPSEIVVTDTIADFAPFLISARKQLSIETAVDVITLIPSANKALMDRNREMVREIVQIVCPQMNPGDLEERLSSFKELKHRQEVIAQKNNVIYISDVLSTAPEASLGSIDDLTLRFPDATIYLLCGGAFSNVDLNELAQGLNNRQSNVTTIALPETGHMIEDKLENFVHCDELKDGVKYVYANAKSGDIVLLAPGAPSFHRYKNYEELAAHFEQLIADLK